MLVPCGVCLTVSKHAGQNNQTTTHTWTSGIVTWQGQDHEPLKTCPTVFWWHQGFVSCGPCVGGMQAWLLGYWVRQPWPKWWSNLERMRMRIYCIRHRSHAHHGWCLFFPRSSAGTKQKQQTFLCHEELKKTLRIAWQRFNLVKEVCQRQKKIVVLHPVPIVSQTHVLFHTIPDVTCLFRADSKW